MIDAEAQDKLDTAWIQLFYGSDSSVENKKIAFVQQFVAIRASPTFLYHWAAAICAPI